MALTEILLHWYDRSGRALPWRTQSSPYAIWLSEVILQQTRVEQGLPYWERFLRELPDVESLAGAPRAQVQGLWSGLGYYRRAEFLHLAAKQITKVGWPKGHKAWLSIPGVGSYTAGALASILDGEAVPALDGNAYRVYSRLANWTTPVDTSEGRSFIHNLAMALIPKNRPGDFNQALMDLAQLHCTPRSPKCTSCPVSDHCAAREAGTAASLPVKRPKAPARSEHWHFTALHRDGRFGLVQRPPGGIWPNLYALPQVFEPISDAAVDILRHRLSHRALTVHIYHIAESPHSELTWLHADEWRDHGMPKVFEHWLTKFPYI